MPFPVKKGNSRVRRRSPVASSTTASENKTSKVRKTLRPPRRSGQRSSYTNAISGCQTNSTNTSGSLPVHNDFTVSDVSPVVKLNKIENISCKSQSSSEENIVKQSKVSKKVCKSDGNCKTGNLSRVLQKKALADNQENDVKLSTPCSVSITCEERMKAETAIMKLRKGQRNDSISDRISKAGVEDSDLSSSTSEYEDSQSDDDDKSFEPSRAYPFRKKSTSSNKSASSRSFSHVASSNSSTESSSESLPDLDFPITGSWASTTTTVSTSSCKPPVSETTSIGYRKRSVSGTNSTSSCHNGSSTNESRLKQGTVMGSTQSKNCSNEASSSSKKPSPIVSRSLRSSDGIHKTSESAFSVSENLGKYSTRSSPERSHNRSSIEKSSSSKPTPAGPDTEKSYSLRCLDKKDPKRSTAPTSETTTTTQQDDKGSQSSSQITPIPGVVQKRGRGRPRKYPLVVQPKSGESGGQTVVPEQNLTPCVLPQLPAVESGRSLRDKPSTPLTRSQRRAVQTEKPASPVKANKKDVIVQEALPGPELDKKKPRVLKRVDGGVKKGRVRNALAARARQSKMIAKSRVLHSRKRDAASWRGIGKKRNSGEPLEETSDQDLSSPVEESEESSTSNDNPEDLKNDAVQDPDQNTENDDAKEISKAKCEVCNITFTRRFSLTKHLNTRQHHKKAQLHRLGLTSKAGRIRRLVGRPRLQKNTSARTSQSKFDNIHSNEEPLVEDFSVFTSELAEADDNHDSTLINADLDKPDDFDMMNGHDDDEDNQDFDEEDDDDESSSQEPEAWSSGKVLGKNDFECDVCGDKFNNKFEFASHLWNHRQDSDLTCSVCGLKFADSDAYNIHIDSAHLSTIKYNCSICPSKFSREDYLKKHEAFHKLSQSERFRCTICEKRLGSQEMLQRHRELRHFMPSNNSHYGKVSKWKNHHVNLRTTSKIPEFITCDEPPNEDEEMDLTMGLYLDGSPVKMKGASVPRREANDCYVTEAACKYDFVPLITPEDYGREIPVEICNPHSGTTSHSHPNSFTLEMDPFGVPADFSRTISTGCGYKTSVVNNKDIKFNALQCPDCRKVFQSRRALYNHCKYFTQGERHVCHTCKKIFKFKHHLNRHMLRHTMQKDAASKSLITIRKPSFFKHRTVSGNHRSIPKLMPIVSPELNPVETPSLSSVGDIPSSNSLLLKDSPQSKGHASSTFDLFKPSLIGNPPDAPQIRVGETSSTVPMKSNTASKNWANCKPTYKQHACELCSKTFTERKTLDVHMYYHQKENLLSCPDCEAKCERKNDLELHFRCHVKRTPFFLCYVCFKPFRWKKDMVRHVRKKHPEERTYRCLYCQDKFRTSEDLTGHVAESHPEHRSFPCEYCGRRYAQKRYLILHIQNQHGPGNDSGMVMMMSPSNVLRDEDNDGNMDLSEDFEIEEDSIDDMVVAQMNNEDTSLNQSFDNEHSFNLSKVEHHL